MLQIVFHVVAVVFSLLLFFKKKSSHNLWKYYWKGWKFLAQTNGHLLVQSQQWKQQNRVWNQWSQWCYSGVIIINFEQISYTLFWCLLCCFEQVNTFTILDVFGISKFFHYRAASEQTFKLLTHFMPLISFCTPENIRKLEVLWCFRGIYKETSSMKWVKFSRHVFLLKMKNSSNMAWYFEKTKFVIPKFSVHSSLFE